MTTLWATKVRLVTEERVLASQSKDYNGHSKHKAMAPAGWYTTPS